MMDLNWLAGFFADINFKQLQIVSLQLLYATQFTIYLSLIAFFGGSLLGLVVALGHILPNRLTRGVASAYMWFFQSTPLLMLLFLFGLAAPRLFELNVDPWVAASAALTIYTSAYLADVWRGSVEAVHSGQWEGGYALGMRFFGVLRRVVAPQAVRHAAAPTINMLVQIIKGTSLAFIIGFEDLMRMGKKWANAPVPDTEPFVIYPLMAVIYFSLCFPLSVWARRIERRHNAERDRPHISQSQKAA
ncbi:MAG: amino acid ABC transporter permease [Neomegalonema sp.]|nr:amino acid ABC transporter permease [Neomegalonema sp.]